MTVFLCVVAYAAIGAGFCFSANHELMDAEIGFLLFVFVAWPLVFAWMILEAGSKR